MSEPRSDFRLIGDPHITRKFEMNVPLARRGEREAALFKQFHDLIWDATEPMVIVVGDTFEKPICSLQDLYKIMECIIYAAKANPDRKYVYMAGNHDISAQANTYGAFDILGFIDIMMPNVYVVFSPCVVDKIAFFPWEWNRTALEQLEDVEGQEFDTAVGHWDLVAYDENHTEHLCPAKELARMGAQSIHSGHWHVAGDYIVEGVTVHCTGSMQPMTHAEDPEGNLYVTLTLEEYNETVPEDLKNKYVRVLAPKGAEVDTLMDCLGFKVLTTVEESGEEDRYDVEIGDFKVADIIQKNLNKHEVPEEVGAFIKERINGDS